MNENEFSEWKSAALIALCSKYSFEESIKVVDWFDTIDTRKEINLVGEETVYSLLCVFRKNFDLYNSLMIRLWVYAPYILKEQE
jgi:hypothetical protein